MTASPSRLTALILLVCAAAQVFVAAAPADAPAHAALPPTQAPRLSGLGVQVGNDTDVARAVPRLRELGVTWVRLWANVDWRAPAEPVSGVFDRARALHAAGFRVIVVLSAHLTDAAPPAYADVKAWCDWAQTRPGLAEAVDVWEILNELNVIEDGRKKYWIGGPDDYVREVLRAAWDSFAPRGELVLGGSFTAYQRDNRIDTSVTRAYLAAGYLNYCHYAGTHPYTRTAEEMRAHFAEVRALYGAKPVIISEWNFKQQRDAAEWARMLDAVRPELAAQTELLCFYRFLATPLEGGWPGLCANDETYTPVEPWFSLFRGWARSAPPTAR
ncbi:MAG: hypothetical protein H7Y06_14735 [Opitutaceae bacterium]|nr:hypothetical protein [Opitutaceae bacterium]